MEVYLDVALAGEEFMLVLYGANSTTVRLNTHMHHCFVEGVATCPIHTQLELTTI